MLSLLLRLYFEGKDRWGFALHDVGMKICVWLRVWMGVGEIRTVFRVFGVLMMLKSKHIVDEGIIFSSNLQLFIFYYLVVIWNLKSDLGLDEEEKSYLDRMALNFCASLITQHNGCGFLGFPFKVVSKSHV